MKAKIVFLAGYFFFILAALFGMATNIAQIANGSYLTAEGLSLGQLIMFTVAFGLTALLLVFKFIRLLRRTITENTINKNQ